MITYIDGDIFRSPADVLVNPVNTKGVMGKGIARRFKQIYPDMFVFYRDICEQKKFDIGQLLLYRTPHKWILNFPTKKHWRSPSRLEYIEAGLRKFSNVYAELGITSIAFPALGCGNGGLDFESQVKPCMEKYLQRVPFPTFIYLPIQYLACPEHSSIRYINQWLRSEPTSLPFNEVWGDILKVLQHRSEFYTRAKNDCFTAIAEDEPPSMTIQSSTNRYQIDAVELLEFWQQLRDFGMIYENIAPNCLLFPYLMPIFERLPYVHPIALAKSTQDLINKPKAGLQVVPPPIPNESLESDLFTNLVYAAQG